VQVPAPQPWDAPFRASYCRRQVISTRTGISFFTGGISKLGGSILKSDSLAGMVPESWMSLLWRVSWNSICLYCAVCPANWIPGRRGSSSRPRRIRAIVCAPGPSGTHPRGSPAACANRGCYPPNRKFLRAPQSGNRTAARGALPTALPGMALLLATSTSNRTALSRMPREMRKSASDAFGCCSASESRRLLMPLSF